MARRPIGLGRETALKKLWVGKFELAVETLSMPRPASARERLLRGVSGTAWLTLTGDGPLTLQPAGDGVVFRRHFEVVHEVRHPQTEMSLEAARRLDPAARVGTSVELPLTVPRGHLSRVAHESMRAVDWARDLVTPGRVLVAFDDVTVERVPRQRATGRITHGHAYYPADRRLPKTLRRQVADFEVEFTALRLEPKSASAEAVLTLPTSIGDATSCHPATLALGRVPLASNCEFYVERPAQAWGPWLIGDTGLLAQGTGFGFDASTTQGAPAVLPAWRGLRVDGGSASGARHIPDPCNSGYLGGEYGITQGVVTPSGFYGALDLEHEHAFTTLNPLGYGVKFSTATLNLAESRVQGGALGHGAVRPPKQAMHGAGGGEITVPFTALSLQGDLNLAGITDAPSDRLVWGNYPDDAAPLDVWAVNARGGLLTLAAGPKPSLCPVTSSGYIDGPPNSAPGPALTYLSAKNISGLVLLDLEDLAVSSPDREGGAPIRPTRMRGWLRVDTFGLDGELWGMNQAKDPLGEPARRAYVGRTPFDAHLLADKERYNLYGQFVSSAVYDSKLGGTLALGPPCGIPTVAFDGMELSSTASMVGGQIELPPAGFKLDHWHLDLVPMGDPAAAGVLSVRTGRIVLTAAGIAEPVHFEAPFRLTWGELLADGNIGELRFDTSALGQRFDGLRYAANSVSLSPYVAGDPASFLATCGTVYFDFFGGASVNIRDAHDTEPAAPFFNRVVKVPSGAMAGACVETDLHLAGAWHGTGDNPLALFDFPNATMGYNDALQDGFIGRGAVALDFLGGGTLDAIIEARSTGIDVHFSASAARDINLGLYAALGGMAELRGCVRVEDSLMKCMNIGAVLERSASTGMGILAPKAGAVVDVNVTVTPTALDFFGSGSMLFSVAGAAADLYAQVHCHHDYARRTVEGEVLGRVDCNSLVGGLEGEGQLTWFASDDAGYLQGRMGVYVASWVGKSALEGGFFVGHNTPKSHAWVLQPDSQHFGISHAILPDRLTGVFGYGRTSLSLNLYVIGGGVEIYAGVGAFSEMPASVSSAWPDGALVGGLPYVVGSCGVHVHGEILGGLVSASAWADLDLRGPVPMYFEGTVGLEGCVLWVLCASVDLTVGLNSGGFYVA